MFYGCSNIIEADLSKADLSEVKNMNDMFNYCINLKSVKLPKNIINVTDMKYMFNYCKSLEVFQVEDIDTKNVTNMSGMFQHCENIKIINLENFNTSKVVHMGCMFNNCYKLTTLLQRFTTEQVKFMSWMFYGCEQLEEIDISSFQFINIEDTSNFLEGCYKLKKIKIEDNYFNAFKNSFPELVEKFVRI